MPLQDAFALLLASHHPQINLIGVSTVHGNASLSHTTRNTLAVLQACSRSSLPLVIGESRPLVREPQAAPSIHGESGLDGVPLLPQPDTSRLQHRPHGTSHITDAILAHPPNTVWIVATGPLTNIAKALAERPEIAAHFAGLSTLR